MDPLKIQYFQFNTEYFDQILDTFKVTLDVNIPTL